MTIRISLCSVCARRRSGLVYDLVWGQVGTCEAYPEGIPIEIWHGADHRQAWLGDGGLRFVSTGTTEAADHIDLYDRVLRRAPA